jgi:flavin reductase (DIM6/NTAB) family NADH-FMN oxidoreductase RutF
MKTIVPSETQKRQLVHYLQGSIGPRPIAFASTINNEGLPNIAPFSYFNIFSSVPPVLIFSIGLRQKDGSEKDTVLNIRQNMEVVINVVSYSIVRQMALASVEFSEDINEFDVSGLTPLPSQIVKPFRIKQSPVHFECKVLEIKSLGLSSLIIAEAVLIHIDEGVLDWDQKIDPNKMDLVGRLGAFNYCRANENAIFQVVQPRDEKPLGFEALPDEIKTSNILTGNELAILAGVRELPEIVDAGIEEFIKNIPPAKDIQQSIIHEKIKVYINQEQVEKAWLVICGYYLR